MKIEKLRNNHKKKIIVGGLVAVGILSTLILTTTRAKYKTTQSINIVNGTVTYKPYDFQMIAMYQKNDSGTYTQINTTPGSDYVINESKSYCTLDGTNKDTNVVLKTINGNHTFANISKNSKCYLYYDKAAAKDIILARVAIRGTQPIYSRTATIDEELYRISDGMYGGDSYVWRGAVNNNWVKFANMYWRIVRINGDGTIRLIYTGNSSLSNVSVDAKGITATGAGTQIQTSVYNSVHYGGAYVGYTYKSGYQRPSATTSGTETASTIKGIIDTWYNNNIGNNTSYSSKVADGKFCNDRNMASGYTWSSSPSDSIYYAAYERIYTNKTPTLSCPSGDVYTLKAGLITADEISMAGGLQAAYNESYYLYTNQNYWTMSPYNVGSSYAYIICVHNKGGYTNGKVEEAKGVRPVINLKGDTQFATDGDGTRANPYVVV